VYAVVFKWYLIRMSVRSGVLGVGVVMHVLRLLDERCVVWVLLGAARGECVQVMGGVSTGCVSIEGVVI